MGELGPFLSPVVLYSRSAITPSGAGFLTRPFLSSDFPRWARIGSGGDPLGGEDAPADVEGI